jgi:hypothetical protein
VRKPQVTWLLPGTYPGTTAESAVHSRQVILPILHLGQESGPGEPFSKANNRCIRTCCCVVRTRGWMGREASWTAPAPWRFEEGAGVLKKAEGCRSPGRFAQNQTSGMTAPRQVEDVLAKYSLVHRIGTNQELRAVPARQGERIGSALSQDSGAWPRWTAPAFGNPRTTPPHQSVGW